MYWRIFYGVLKTLLGFTFLNLINVPLIDLLYKVMRPEIIEDPTNVFYAVVNNLLQHHPLSVTYFLSIYLIFWGLVDIFLSAALLKHKHWAFPTSLWLIVFFVIYELHRFSHTHSLMLLIFILIDIFIFWLIQREYKKFKLPH
jgi:uncharacterized membrane protein